MGGVSPEPQGTIKEVIILSFWCKYCGKEKHYDERDYNVGLLLAERASFEALGHEEEVSPYLICELCAEEILKGENDEKIK